MTSKNQIVCSTALQKYILFLINSHSKISIMWAIKEQTVIYYFWYVICLTSLVKHLKHLVIIHVEVNSLSRPTKRSATLLTLIVSVGSFFVVVARKFGVWTFCSVAVIADHQIVSESRTAALIAVNDAWVVLAYILFAKIQLK